MLQQTFYALLKVAKRPPSETNCPDVRRLIPVLVGLVIVVAGLIGLLAVFHGKDQAELSGNQQAQGPGTFESQPGDPPTSGTPGGNLQHETSVPNPVLIKALSIGDVALVYGTPKPPPELVQLQEDATGAFDPELAAAGQMAFLVHRKGVAGIQALAWQRRLETSNPADQGLRDFIDAWLGKGKRGGG
jgi:hypothetical protein